MTEQHRADSLGGKPLDEDHKAGRLPEDSVGGTDERPARSSERALGDFTTGVEILRLLPLAVVVGALSAGVAVGLLDLIGLITNAVYFGRFSTSLVQPELSHVGAAGIAIPVAGGLIVGLMARFGSERIRGHGIPEAMETILIGGSRVEPRLAVLKPVSSAVSIGTGGPFGAEGPIILTGGAVGSVLAQFFRLSAIERRALLVAGACAGMAAVFGTPVAAAMFGVELLVFEWKPRTMVPIAVSVVVADALRAVFAHHHLLRPAPLFPVAAHPAFSALGIAQAAALGVAAGALAWVLTNSVYGAEDLFKRLPIHWAWWPAIGGAVIGVGGAIDPRALGVGYAGIADELAGRLAIATLLLLLVVKLVIWSIGLGSGTSGGILAPLLIMGAAMGGVLGHGFGGGGTGSWALVGMAGTLAGVTRSPFTSVIFALELTHDTGSLLALLASASMAHVVSVLTLRRSILTEKVARRGFHVMREYAVDPLEAMFVREVMLDDLLTIQADVPVSRLRQRIDSDPAARRQRLYPVTGDKDDLLGVVTGSDLATLVNGDAISVGELMHLRVVSAFPDETLRIVADRMAEHELGALPVVDRGPTGQVVGLITIFELLVGRRRQLEEERVRQQSLRLWRIPRRTRLER